MENKPIHGTFQLALFHGIMDGERQRQFARSQSFHFHSIV